jgi:fucose permease
MARVDAPAADTRRLVAGASALFFVLGVAIAMLGPILPGLRRDLHAGDIGAAAMIGGWGAGWGASVLLAGPLADRIGRRRPALAGAALLAVSLGMIGLAPVLAVAVAGALFAGFGGGALTVAVNPALVDAGERALLVANAGFAVGAVVAPALVALSVAAGIGWRATPCLAAGIGAVAVLGARAIPDGAVADGRLGMRALVRIPAMRVLAVVMAFEICAEGGTVGWVSSYVSKERGYGDALAAAVPTAFWLGQVATRLSSTRRPLPRPERALPVLPLVAAAGIVALLLVPGVPAVLIAAAVIGLAAGNIFPLLISAATERFPADANAATGLMLGGGGLLEIGLPLALGATSEAAGTRAAGMVVAALLYVLCAAAARGLRTPAVTSA